MASLFYGSRMRLNALTGKWISAVTVKRAKCLLRFYFKFLLSYILLNYTE